MQRISLLVVGAVALSAACSRTEARLSPAPEATLAAGGRGATATAAGVTVVARPGAWEWGPRDLEAKVTPILIEIENASNRPIAVRYNTIALTDAQGHRFAAMPPYDVDATVTEQVTVTNPYYGLSRFRVAPYLSRWYPRFSRYGGAFAYDASYYSPYITAYRRIELPTVDMVQRALPEGVLEPSGKAEGFVYFEPLDRDAGTVNLSVDLVDVATGVKVGMVNIPFVAR